MEADFKTWKFSRRSIKGLTLFCAITCFTNIALGEAPKREPLTTLSNGKFDRELEVPPSETLEEGSPLQKAAASVYGKLPFDIGERIRYVITYLGVKGGYFEYVIKPPVKWQETWAHRITAEAKNADWYAWAVTLHDAMECLFDNTNEMTPLRFYLNQQEPVSFRQSKIIDFNIKENKVKQHTKRKERSDAFEEFPFAPGTKDALTSIYYFRANVKPGEGKDKTIEFPIFTSEKTWTGKATLVKEETIKVGDSKYECDVYDLKTQFGQIMEQKGHIRMWLTKDFRRLPVYIEAEVKFGNLKLTLDEWDQGNANPAKKQIYEKIRVK